MGTTADRPTVTVVVPTYNRAHLLGRALASVQAQTFDDWECVVVDDGSQDDPGEIVRRLDDPRFRIIRHDRNRGASAARNTGIDAARGEYVGFLDSDDEWMPEKLEKQLAVFRDDPEGKIGAVVCGRILIDGKSARPFPGPDLGGADAYRLFVTEGLGGLGAYGYLVRASVLATGVRFDLAFPTCEDRDFLAQIAASFQIASVREPLMRQHRDEDGHLWGGMNAAVGLERMIVKYRSDLGDWPAELARLHRTAGLKFLIAGDARAGRRHFGAALRCQPSHVAGYAWFLVSLLGTRAARRLYPIIVGAEG